MSADEPFFEIPEPIDDDDAMECFEPVWMTPPRNELGRTVPCDIELARTDDLVVAVRGVLVYSSGLTFGVLARLREPQQSRGMIGAFYGELEPGSPEVLRVGVQFANGQKVTNLDGYPDVDWESDDLPEEPVLIEGGGGGDGREYSTSYWLWPLPPPGELTFVCEWPAHGVPVTRRKIETAPILAAAARSETLWSLPER